MKSPYPFYKSSNPLLSEHSKDLDIFLGLPFWCNNLGNNATCCFNHIIGLPEKNNKEYPIFDYELDVINKIENNRNIWIKKASGIGATTLILRYLVWKIVSSNDLEYKNIFIVSGTHLQHANDVKVKMEDLFRKRFPLLTLESKYTGLWIRNTNIRIFPSRNVKDLRGYTDVSYLFIDESDFFENSVTTELEHAITRYEEKSHCTTIMVSTPNAPGGLFQRIELDPNSKYHKIILTYEYGLDKIYDRQEIEKKKLEPEFAREYMGQYLGRVGNVFSPILIDQCIKKYDLVKDIPPVYEALHVCGIDPGFGSSQCGVVMTEHLKNPEVVRVLFAEQYEKANPTDIINLCFDMHRKFHPNIRFLIDGANVGFVRQMKVAFGESPTWESEHVHPDIMEILPISFGSEHKEMLSHLYTLMNKGYIAIPEKYDKLIVSLRTAQAKEYSLDKNQTSYSDLLDGLRLSLKGYNIK